MNGRRTANPRLGGTPAFAHPTACVYVTALMTAMTPMTANRIRMKRSRRRKLSGESTPPNGPVDWGRLVVCARFADSHGPVVPDVQASQSHNPTTSERWIGAFSVLPSGRRAAVSRSIPNVVETAACSWNQPADRPAPECAAAIKVKWGALAACWMTNVARPVGVDHSGGSMSMIWPSASRFGSWVVNESNPKRSWRSARNSAAWDRSRARSTKGVSRRSRTRRLRAPRPLRDPRRSR